MSRKKSKVLTGGELRIMKVIWRLGDASVRQITDELQADGPIAYNTAQTMMGILVDKGYLERRKAGRAYVYTPLVSRTAARTEALGQLIGSFFAGSRRELVHNLLDDATIDAAELDEIRRLLDDSRQQRDKP